MNTKMYIQDISVSGVGGKAALDVTFNPFDNLIFSGGAAGLAASLPQFLGSALKNDSSMLTGLSFEEAAVRIADKADGVVYTHRIRKKDIPMGEEARDGRDVASPWRIDPPPRGNWTPGRPHLYLPASRVYTPRDKRSRGIPREGRPPANRLDNTLYALWKAYFLRASTRLDRALRQGAVDVLASVFSRAARENGTVLKASPQTAYMRVSSFLEKSGVDDGIVSFSTFREDLENDAGVRRIVTCIQSIDEKLDKFVGEVETLKEAANRMPGPRVKIPIDPDIPGIQWKNSAPVEWRALSPGRKSALILLFATLLATNGVLLVDEVDSALDGDPCKELIKYMRALNPDGQFILTTRSPGLMDSVSPEAAFRG
ncbi:MAG: ATP-binding protein [Desulfobacterales bacterium]|nr:ATP-binding protein [Desulfobacterales bacterium]